MRDRIMIVGRDVELRAQLARLLKGGGYRVEIAESASHACRIGFSGIALAIVAPDGRGPEERGLLQELRTTVGNFLLVAAPGSKHDPNSDLLDVTDETGLLARVAEVLAPASEPDTAEPTLQFAGYRLDLGGHSLLDPAGTEVPLTHREFSLLRVLVQKAGRALSREQLLQILAGRESEAYDRSIDMQIVRLRRKIEPDPKHPTLIVTVPNAGYKFAAKVHQAEAPAPELQQTAVVPPVAAPTHPERRYITALAAELVPAAGGSLLGDPEELLAVINAYRRYATTIVARHGGTIAESRGREVLAYFGFPVAREHAAERAIHTALALADHLAEGEESLPAGLAVRVGVASGGVLAGPANEVMGEPPGEAVRLLNAAESGAVVVDEATRRLTGALFEWTDLGEVPLRGAPHSVHAWRALGQSAVESRFEALRAPQLSPLVGREEELDLLLRRWRSAVAGEGQAVLICGEPGIGKSRLMAELVQRIGNEPHEVLRYFCSPYQKDTPLYPVTVRWEHEAGFVRGDSGNERLQKLQAIMGPNTPPEDFSLIADVLNLPIEGRQKLELSPQRRRERTFGLLLKLLRQRAERQPVLMLLEDVHWSDASTMELFDLLIGELPNLRVLLVMSFRPEYTSPWIGQAGVTLITLSRLTQTQSTTLAAQVMQDKPLPTTILDRVVALTDGVPLFIEELTRTLLEQAASGNAALTVPATLQASLMARLDRMPATKQVAQIAAVIGLEAPHALLAEVSGLPEPVLSEGLDALVASGLAFRRGTPPDATYIFKHALVQEAAYESLLRSRRIEIHGSIATVLARNPETSADAAATIGRHFAEADQIEHAAHWYRRAGERSAERSAIAETKAQLQRGLELAAMLPESPARHRLEAELQLALGRTLVTTNGFADAEAGAAFERATTLCRTLNDLEMLTRARGGELIIAIQRGRVKDCRQICEELLTLAENNVSAELAARAVLGCLEVAAGFFAESQKHLRPALEKLDQFPEHRVEFPGVGSVDGTAAAYLAAALAIQGFVTEAHTWVAEALRRVEFS